MGFLLNKFDFIAVYASGGFPSGRDHAVYFYKGACDWSYEVFFKEKTKLPRQTALNVVSAKPSERIIGNSADRIWKNKT